MGRIINESFTLTGRKVGKGIYVYSKNSKSKDRSVCPETIEIVKRFALKPKGFMDDQDLQLRIASRFINDAVLCLQENILANPVRTYFVFSVTGNLHVSVGTG